MQLLKTHNTPLTLLKVPRALYVLTFCLVIICFHLFFYTGHFGFDDMGYAQYAFELSQGNLQLLDDHYAYRLGVLWPTAIAYILFGVNDGASAIMPILASFTILFLVNDMLKKEKVITALLAMAMLTFTFWNLHYSDKLMPDIWVSFGVTIACYALYRQYFDPPKWKIILPILMAIGIFYAFLSKEIVLFTLPAFAIFWLKDIFKKQHITFWLTTIGLGILVFGVYFLHQYISTGNALARIAAIKSGTYYSPTCSYAELPLENLIKRIIYLPFAHVGGDSGFAIPCVLAISAFIFVAARIIKNQRIAFFSTLFFALFVGAFWMSASLSAYSPICIDPRHFLFLLPMASIAASMLVINFFNNKKVAVATCIVFLIISIACVVNKVTFRESTIVFTIGLIVYTLAKHFKNRFINTAAVGIMLIALVVSPAIIIKSFNSPNQYKIVKQHTYDLINNATENTFIVTTQVQENIGNYLNEFGNKNPKVQFVSYKPFDANHYRYLGKSLFKVERILIFNNRHTQNLSGKNANDMPKYFFEPIANGKVLLNENGTFIQEVKSIKDLTWE